MNRRLVLLFVLAVGLAALAFAALGPLGGPGPRQSTAEELERRYEAFWGCQKNLPTPRVSCRPKDNRLFNCELSQKVGGRTTTSEFVSNADASQPSADC